MATRVDYIAELDLQAGEPVDGVAQTPMMIAELDVCPQCGCAFWNPKGDLLECSFCTEDRREYQDEMTEAWSVGCFF
jgi:hypothetical protein